jgi:hypothetical protein
MGIGKVTIDIIRPTASADLPASDARQIRLVAWGVRLRWRGGVLVWLRPLAVEVRHGEVLERLPIHDTTLRALVALALLSGAMIGAAWRRGRRERKKVWEQNT